MRGVSRVDPGWDRGRWTLRIAIDAVGIRIGGAAVILTDLVVRLCELRPLWNFRLFLLPPEQRFFADPTLASNLSVEYVPLRWSSMSRLGWALHGLPTRARSLRPDVLLCLANIAPLRCSTPYVLLVHQPNAVLADAPRSSRLQQLRMAVLRLLIRRSVAVSASTIVQTRTMARAIRELAPGAADRVHVILSPVLEVFRTGRCATEKALLVDAQPRPRILYVSHPSWHKNHVRLMRAFGLVREAFPSARLLLTVEPPGTACPAYDGVRGVVQEIYREAAALGLGESVVWLGILRSEEVAHVLRNSDLFVFPSLAESFGLPLVEAMAAGCPVAASNLEFAREVCEDAAVYFDSTDPAAMARTINGLLSDPLRLQRLREAGLRRAEMFSSLRVAEQFCLLLEKAAKFPHG